MNFQLARTHASCLPACTHTRTRPQQHGNNLCSTSLPLVVLVGGVGAVVVCCLVSLTHSLTHSVSQSCLWLCLCESANCVSALSLLPAPGLVFAAAALRVCVRACGLFGFLAWRVVSGAQFKLNFHCERLRRRLLSVRASASLTLSLSLCKCMRDCQTLSVCACVCVFCSTT